MLKAPIRWVVVMALAGSAGCAMPSGDEAALDEGPNAGVQLGPKSIEPEAQRRVAATREELTFTGCTQAQIYSLALIWPQARLLAERGYSYQKVDKNKFWAQYWFGYPSQANNTLLGVQTRLQNGNLNILCDDGPLDRDHHPSCNGFYARAQSKMRICEAFWRLSAEDAVLVILHETAHFAGAPNDTAYSEQACYDLARSNPTAAAKNAANYEHYYNMFW